MEFHFFGFKIAIIRFSLYRWLSQILQNKFVGYSFLVNWEKWHLIPKDKKN